MLNGTLAPGGVNPALAALEQGTLGAWRARGQAKRSSAGGGTAVCHCSQQRRHVRQGRPIVHLPMAVASPAGTDASGTACLMSARSG